MCHSSRFPAERESATLMADKKLRICALMSNGLGPRVAGRGWKALGSCGRARGIGGRALYKHGHARLHHPLPSGESRADSPR